MPLWAAPWLRQQMAEMLEKDAEAEESVAVRRIGPMPAVPEWVEQLRTNVRTITQATKESMKT